MTSGILEEEIMSDYEGPNARAAAFEKPEQPAFRVDKKTAKKLIETEEAQTNWQLFKVIGLKHIFLFAFFCVKYSDLLERKQPFQAHNKWNDYEM
jgi:hypothetical protein